MKTLRNIVANPHAILFAAAHWMLALYLAFDAQTAGHYFSWERNRWEDYLSTSIFLVDLPAIFLAALFCSPLKLVNSDVFEKGLFFMSIFTITLQWMIVGKTAFSIFKPTKSKMTLLSLNDE